MKVFLSWSGHKSHQVALAFRDWLPSVIQSITPYVSSEDIDKGARWSTDIAKELEDSTFGILCVTKDNLEAPWLLFEAGALSKMMDKAFVCPFIFDLKRAEVKGPILQFQSTIFEKEDVKKLLLTLNKAGGESSLREELLTKTFEVWWPNLKETLDKIKGEASEEEKTSPEKTFSLEILEEILELTRTNQKLLRSPETLLPPNYLEFLFNERLNRNLTEKDKNLLEQMRSISIEIKRYLMQIMNVIDMYKNERRSIDEDFFMEFRRLFDLIQHQQIMFEQLNRIYRRF